MMPEPSVATGENLGPYVLGDRLGLGGMAEVYVAYRGGPRGFAKKFALKRILPELAQDARFVAMFCDEARICAALCHPNIVQVVDFGESRGELFMAMEYVDGVSLAKLLRAVSARGERFPLGAALYIAHEVLRGLSFAHEAADEEGRPFGIVHRDVSPGNVLIGRAGEVKLGDFGIVRSAFVDRRTYPGELKGKVGYMSPEQVMGAELDPRSDLFTVGIILAEMLLARPLFPGHNEFDILTNIYEANLAVLEKHGTDLPEELLSTLRRALARTADQRFQTAREFADAIREVARNANLSLGDALLVPWFSGLGILPSRSGTHEVSGGRSPSDKQMPAVRPRKPSSGTMSAQAAGPPTEPLRFGERHTAVALWKQELDRARLPSLFYSIAARGDSGALVFRHHQREKHLYFMDGELRAGASTDRRELLGARLVRSGRITQAQLEIALESAILGKKKIGEVLVEHGLLRPSSLLRELIEQLEDSLIECFTWQRAVICFVPNARRVENELKATAFGPNLITRAIRESYSDEDIARWFGPVSKQAVVRGLARRIDPTRIGLTIAERRVLEQAVRGGTVQGIVNQTAADRVATSGEALRGLFIGISVGLITVRGFGEQG